MSIFDRIRLDGIAADAIQVRYKASNAQRRIQQLEKEVDALTLICMGMWELLGKSNGFFLKDLESKMEEIDLRDGTLDGAPPKPTECGKCGRKLGARRKICVFCGSPAGPAG